MSYSLEDLDVIEALLNVIQSLDLGVIYRGTVKCHTVSKTWVSLRHC